MAIHSSSTFRRLFDSTFSPHVRAALLLAAVAVVLGISALPSQAVVRFWSGDGTNNNWSVGANLGGTPPSAGDDLIFPSGVSLRLTNTNDYPSNTVFSSITFLGSGYSLQGNALA